MIDTLTCPKDVLHQQFFIWREHYHNRAHLNNDNDNGSDDDYHGGDPRTFSPLRTVYIRHDRPRKLVYITSEDAIATFENEMLSRIRVQHLHADEPREAEVSSREQDANSKNDNSEKNNNDDGDGEKRDNRHENGMGRREQVPCRDLHTLSSIPESREKQRRREQESFLYRTVAKYSRMSQNFAAHMFNCEKNGFDENHSQNTHDIFTVFLAFTVFMLLV